MEILWKCTVSAVSTKFPHKEIWWHFGILCREKSEWLCDFNTAWKVSKYRVFSGLYFPVFGLNTKIYSINIRIQFEYRKIRTRKVSIFRHFSYSATLKNIWQLKPISIAQTLQYPQTMKIRGPTLTVRALVWYSRLFNILE